MKNLKKLLFLPLCMLFTLTVHSQSWRDNSDLLVVNQLFDNDINSVDIYTFPNMLTTTDSIVLADGTIIQVPYSNCYAYFINLMPMANWSHPCKYCFVNASMGHVMVSANMPPMDDNMVALSLRPRTNPNPSPILFDTTFVRNCRTTDTSHKWAVLICGSGEETRFWFDLSSVYTVLTDVYGYQEGSVWNSFANRRIIATAPDAIRKKFIPYNDINSAALNGTNPDGQGDFFNYEGVDNTSHSKQNIHNIFKCFAGDQQCLHDYSDQGLQELTEEDQLFIYITGHGFTEGGDDISYIRVKEQYDMPKIYDDTLVSWLRNIKCSQMTLVMQNCYSGAFIEKFMDDISNPDCLCKNRIGQSAASAKGVSWAENYNVYQESSRELDPDSFANEFTYYWTSAALGYYPYYKTKEVLGYKVIDKGPWTANDRVVGSGNMIWSDYFGNYENNHPHYPKYDTIPDTDGDTSVSLNEMFEFANNLDTWSRQGYYYPNHNDTTGQQFDPQYQPEFPQQRYESTFTKEAATLAGYEGQIDSIANSGIATQPYRLCGDIWVGPDSELTMWDEVQSPENVKIYVKPSGKLFLDGATLTNLPEVQSPMWEGVQVWGNSSVHQHEVNGSYLQGYIELKNGAVIENAKCAVELWHPGYSNTTGGIIHATDATFRNNAKAVHILLYTYSYTGRISDYNGYFRNCSFVVDEDYLGTKTFLKHVELTQVNGIDFHGCVFSAKKNVQGVSPDCLGIGAYGAGFRVDSYCDQPSGGGNISPCPPQYQMHSSFTGFNRGIHASNYGGTTYGFRVNDTDFNNNTCGIYALNSGYGVIVNNDFTVDCSSNCNFGIYTDGVSGFCIEDNTFRSDTIGNGLSYGIEIAKSNGINDVYHNDFYGLYCGNVAVGDSTNISPKPDSTLGITYTCNTNTNNVIDFCVLKDNNFGDIASMQGSTSIPAGNTFSGSQYQFYNDGNQPITYYYDSNEQSQIPVTSLLYRVNRYGLKVSNSCLSHYGGGGAVSKSASEKASLASDYLTARSTYNSLLQLYESRIDGGNTPAQVADINSATPSDMWRLRAQLLGLSPYVSGEVLTTAADRYDVFTDPILFEILAANPDELKKDTLISYLENKEHPLPSYMTDLLRQMASGFTARTALLAQMAQYKHAYSLAAGDIVRSCLNDSITDLTELRTWLGNMDDIASDQMIIASYLQEGDSINAFTLANMLPELYNLQGDALSDHSDYMRLISLYQTLNREHRSVFELTDTEIALVNGIALSGIGTSQTMADALLEEISQDHLRTYSCPTMPENNNGNRGNVGLMDASMNEALGFTVSVSPNPATTWVKVDYTLPASVHSASLSLTNTYGVTVANYELSAGETQKVLDLRFLADGVYFYTVLCGKHSQTGKLIIVK
ncbi:MAG: T9SS type A sorting domain-containing protein [Bacteroidales bacterium]|nr:T9SS type A sorting domain-containing protein [Bacteroidales bacterium]